MGLGLDWFSHCPCGFQNMKARSTHPWEQTLRPHLGSTSWASLGKKCGTSYQAQFSKFLLKQCTQGAWLPAHNSTLGYGFGNAKENFTAPQFCLGLAIVSYLPIQAISNLRVRPTYFITFVFLIVPDQVPDTTYIPWTYKQKHGINSS